MRTAGTDSGAAVCDFLQWHEGNAGSNRIKIVGCIQREGRKSGIGADGSDAEHQPGT